MVTKTRDLGVEELEKKMAVNCVLLFTFAVLCSLLMTNSLLLSFALLITSDNG